MRGPFVSLSAPLRDWLCVLVAGAVILPTPGAAQESRPPSLAPSPSTAPTSVPARPDFNSLRMMPGAGSSGGIAPRPESGVQYWEALLRPVISAPESRQLAAEIGALIQQRETKRAERLLAATVEAGVLASLIIHQTDDANLLSYLKTLGPIEKTPSTAPGSPNDGRDPNSVAELKQALAREKERADTAARDLTTVQGQLAQRESNNSRITKELTAEKERAAAATRELTTARSQLAQLEADRSKTAKDLAAEKERAAAVVREWEAAQAQLSATQPQTVVGEVFARETERADEAVRELEIVRGHLASLESDYRKLDEALAAEREQAVAAARERDEEARHQTSQTAAIDIDEALAREKAHSNSIAEELRVARGKLASLEAEYATVNEALASERERTAAMTRDREAQLSAMQSKVAELDEALGREEKRAGTTERELNGAREHLARREAEYNRVTEALAAEKQRAEAAARQRDTAFAALATRFERIAVPDERRKDRAAQPIPVTTPPEPNQAAVPTGADDAAQSRATTSPAQAPTGSPEPEPAPIADPAVASPHAAPRAEGGGIATPNETPTPADQASARPAAVFLLLTRADALVRSGDVSGARLLLEHAVAAGNARAAFQLAETYDPNVLAQRKTLGLKADAAKARELYQRARKDGIEEADMRIGALK
jgi:hypothetical protein